MKFSERYIFTALGEYEAFPVSIFSFQNKECKWELQYLWMGITHCISETCEGTRKADMMYNGRNYLLGAIADTETVGR